MAFGTLFTLDAVSEVHGALARDIGEDKLFENLDGFFAAHNVLFAQAAEQIGMRTVEREGQFGGTAEAVIQELDEFGQPSAQKIEIPAYNVGWPLRRFGGALQWTRFAFENMSARQFEVNVNAIADADEQEFYRQLRRAIYRPTNYTFTDWLEMPKKDLPVKALLNADGQHIPEGPGGVTFDGSTHTHYLGVTTANTPTQAEYVAAMAHVIEHFNTGSAAIYINRGDESTVREFSDFKPYIDARLVDQRTQIVTRTSLDQHNLYDRAIGLLDGAEVIVKPWVVEGYPFFTMRGIEPPVAVRQPRFLAAQSLRLVAQDENYPLRATEWEHRYGIGIGNRANGAVLDTKTGSKTYTAPSL